ncbi:MAG: hypothetical protein L0I97_07715, partial [Staphylococcus simulans]|nr:hypothetical protein [Staphylococcus simulans]
PDINHCGNLGCEAAGTLFLTTAETFSSKSRRRYNAAYPTRARILLYEDDDDVYFKVTKYLL